MKKGLRMFAGAVMAFLMVAVSLLSPIGAYAGHDTEYDSFDEETPAFEGFDITVIGGTASFVNKDGAFEGKAFAGDLLRVALTPVSGRTFLKWESIYGAVIQEETFTMYVAAPEWVYPVFTDTDDYPFGEWELVYNRGCIEGVLYRAENTVGDVRYKLERRYDHEFEYTPVDADMHLRKCTICGYEEEPEEHSFSSWSDQVIKEPTHDAPGEILHKCDYCGYEKVEYTDSTNVHEWGPWEVLEPSVNGQYGKRKRTCRYCDESETVWYLAEPDLKDLIQNHFIQYEADVGSNCYFETYTHFTRDDGKEAYVFAERWQTSNGRDGDRFWIWLYLDDENPETLDPVYLSCSASTSMLGAFRWAHYTYVYDFDGWIDVIDRPSSAVLGAPITLGNLMDSRDSKLQSWAGKWAKTYNALAVPATEDPEAPFITTTGEGHKWEKTGESTEPYASKSVLLGQDENNVSLWTYYGGFDAVYYRMQVRETGNSPYDYITVDPNTGLTLRSYEPFSSFDVSFRLYQEVVSAEEYAEMDEFDRQGYISVDDLASRVNVSWGNTAFKTFSSDFSFDVPDPVRAVRFYAENSGNYTVSAKNFPYYIAQYGTYNPARIVYAGAAISANYPEEYAITLDWDENNTYNHVFDRWEKWNFATQSWDLISTEPTIKLNTYGSPLTEATIVHAVYHTEEVYYHVAATNGTFEIDGESGEFTEKDVPQNAIIYLSAEPAEGKYVDHWEDEDGNVLSNSWGFRANGSHTYHPVYRNETYSFYAGVYGDHGKVYAAGFDSEDEDRFVSVEGVYGETVELSTTCDDEGFSFMGWYLEGYGKDEMNPGPVYTLLSEEETWTYTFEGTPDGMIYAVWSDGTVFLGDPYVKVDAYGGFVMREPNGFDYRVRDLYELDGKEDSEPIYFVNGYSSLMVRCNQGFSVIDDPTEGAYESTEFRFRWNGPEGQEKEIVSVEEYDRAAHYYLSGAEMYPELRMEVLALLQPGDVNGSTDSTTDDVVTLLYSVYFDESPAAPFLLRNDYNNDGALTDDDAIYLLFNKVYPDLYPIE